MDETSRREYLILSAVIITMMANQTAIVIISPLAVDIAETFDISVSLSGQLRTVAGLISGGLAPFVGLLSDRYGRQRIMMFGLLSITGFGLASSVAPTFGLLLLAQSIAGFGIAALLSSGYAIAADAFPAERRAWAVGIISIGQPMAWVIGLPLIGIVADTVGWRWSFVAVPVLVSLIALLFIRWVPKGGGVHPQEQSVAQSPLHGIKVILRNSSARSWIISELVTYSGWAGSLVFLGAFYITVYGLSTFVTSLFLSVTALAFVAGSLVSHRVTRQFGIRWTVMGAAGLAGIALILSLVVDRGQWFSLVMIMVFALMQGVRGAAASLLGLMQVPEHQGAMMGFRASVVQLGYVLGGGFGGILLATGGYSLLAVIYGIGIFTAATFMGFRVTGTERRAPVA